MRASFPLLVLLLGCSEYGVKKEQTNVGTDDSSATIDTGENPGIDKTECPVLTAPVDDCGVSDACDYSVGGFEPVVDWYIPGSSNSLPVVADLDGDGNPEVIANMLDGLLGPSHLEIWAGDGSHMIWDDTSHKTAFGSHPAVADVDNDGKPDIYMVIVYKDNLFGAGEFTVGRWSADGKFIVESDHFTDWSFDHATGLIISDMDHDGTPEIVAGRAIFTPDLVTRAIGNRGRGASSGIEGIAEEGSTPAVADLDLDGQEEIITGNAAYSADARVVWSQGSLSDGSPSIANLDDDPEGEFVVSVGNTIRAQDTDGKLMWGPLEIKSGNILSSPAIGDLDGDGLPEIVVAGGNKLWVLHRDGSMFWQANVTDETGATGASIFDFDADGVPEVVYISEVEMVAYNGIDGVEKFKSKDHGSDTMYDYPVIADVDNDGHAEILVANKSNNKGVVVYKDKTNSWAPARKLWNQHAYSITNINDNLTVPQTAVQNFTLYNNYHSGVALPPGETLGDDVQSDIAVSCEEDCNAGWLRVVGRLRNLSNRDLPAGVSVALYARTSKGDVMVGTSMTTDEIPSGKTSRGILFSVPADMARDSSGLILRADDNGTGTGTVSECVENDNEFWLDGPFCK